MLTTQTELPENFCKMEAKHLHTILNGPTLFHLEGRAKEPVFVSTLLHGNETTGLQVIQKLLLKYKDQSLPRSLSFFIGNIEAAKKKLRRLEHQPDYNRTWPGTEQASSNETIMMQQIKDDMRERHVFVSIDVHNNTGLNPHYACINKCENAFFHLARLFSRTIVYFTRPLGVQSQAFADLCPSVTVECGQVGQSASINHAFEYIDAALHLPELPQHQGNRT